MAEIKWKEIERLFKDNDWINPRLKAVQEKMRENVHRLQESL